MHTHKDVEVGLRPGEMKYVKVHEEDNVVVLTQDLTEGTLLFNDVRLLSDVPQSHKVAIEDIPQGGIVRRYNVVLGYAKEAIKKGEWINEFMLELPTPPVLSDLHPDPDYGGKRALHLDQDHTFMGYSNQHSDYAGTRNILAIHTTVQCVVGVVNLAAKKIKEELLPHYPNVDDVVVINHQYGCGVAINADNADIPIRGLQNLLKHPNFGGEVMVVSLGCEKLTPKMMMPTEFLDEEHLIIIQDYPGFDAIMGRILAMAETKLGRLNQRKRTPQPLSKLLIGMQCGGSDAFSGVSGNPSVGYAADLLVAGGATVMFSEVTEVRDGVDLIAERTISPEVCGKLADEMAWYDDYLEKSHVDRDANPTPGNKKGGLANIVEKAMGSIAKSGTSEIVEVLSPGEIPSRKGLIFAATPASDLVCGTMQMCSGATLQLFVTGRGTPYGLAALPVVKVCTRTDLKNHWSDIIDIDTGGVLTGEKTIADMGQEVFDYVLAVASGETKPFTEKYGIYNDICLFNPAPIT